MAANPRIVSPASGASQLLVNWGGSPGGPPCQAVLLRGQVIDVVTGSALETAIGPANLISVSGNTLNNDQTGSEGWATSNS